jgi:hypothetical protein
MKEDNLSKYIKLAVVLLHDIIPVGFLISIGSAENTDFAGLGFLIGLFLLIVFNLWALFVYKLTKRIEGPVQREVSFYVLVFSFLYAPAFIWLLDRLFY